MLTAVAAAENSLTLDLLEKESWWGGHVVDGAAMPYTAETTIERDTMNNRGNQAQPLLVSSEGRWVWCEQPMKFAFKGGKLTASSEFAEVQQGDAGETLQDAFAHVSKTFFPATGTYPDPLLFTAPQYNTWIELIYEQTQKGITEYANSIVENGYPVGVLMIDDNWQEDYGTWEFSAKRFEQPKEMMSKLHDQGFKVMMWICPFVSADSQTFRHLAKEGMLLLDKQKTQDILWANTRNKAAIVRWWNGASALLDLSNPKSKKWFKEQLDHLQNEYGVDGFKFDAGDTPFYKNEVVSFKKSLPTDHCRYFAEIGLDYPLNEYRACFKLAGQPLAQRLRDKGHHWKDMQQLIPGMIAQGLMGYAFTCPDMIGGGEYTTFLNGAKIDEELVVRSAQVHALMPMMQFSVAPWRILSKENAAICLEMAKLHSKFGEEILEMAKASAKSGAPIVKPLAWSWPGQGYESIVDQFLLGDEILVAPVTKQGARKRSVVFPQGTWKGEDGSTVVGPKTMEIEVPLARLPYYRLQK